MVETKGALLHSPAWYDATVWLFTLGRERALRERTLDLAQIAAGEAVLDVGCGTGTLAIAARRRVGATGRVEGIDPSPEMIARARTKAGRRGAAVRFGEAAAEALPFPDATFDLVLSTLMLHHLPKAVRAQALGEICRVLRPGGRLLIVDFAESGPRHGPLAHFRRHRHGHVKPDALADLASAAGLRIERSGEVGMKGLHYLLAVRGH